MLSLKKCYTPYKNSMAEFYPQSLKETWLENVQAASKRKTPYDIFRRGKSYGNPLPPNKSSI